MFCVNHLGIATLYARIILACAWQGWIVKRTTMISWTGDCPSVQLDLKMLRKNSFLKVSRSKRYDFVRCRYYYIEYSRSIYFYNNNVSTKFNLIDNNDGEIVSIVNPVFLNSDHIRNWLFIPWYELQTICDNFRSCYHDSLREVLRNQTAHELFARTSFFLLIDFYIRKSMKDTPKKNASSVIVKSETKKSIRNQGDGSIFHNHCNIEWIMQYGI